MRLLPAPVANSHLRMRMGAPPNQLYTVFSFIGFVMCFIPLYWHLEAWNVGSCLLMIWTGLGCLIQCINSIVWNNNMADKAPIYCNIAIRIQIGLNVAISACSLCINRRLYKIATAKVVVVSGTEKRRAMLIDLLIGLGIPILQIVVAHVVFEYRYFIFEDYGPLYAIIDVLPAYFLVELWPLAIGCVSFVYSSTTIYILYKRSRQFRELLSFGQGINRGRYFRLMALASIDTFGSIPLATYVLVRHAKAGVVPWQSWADTHSHYSHVLQIPASVWKNEPVEVHGLEMFRWVLVACAFVFFAFFGFGDEAYKHYRLAYTSIARRIGYSKSSGTLHDSSHGTSISPSPHTRTRSRGGVGVSLATVTTSATQGDTPVSSTGPDRLSITTTYVASDLERDSKREQYLSSDPKSEVSLELGLESQLPQREAITPAADPESDLSDLPITGPTGSASIICSGVADSV